MAQIQKGTTYITGDQVTAANLNALADAAILLPGAITDQTAKTVPLAADTILLHSAADTALRKSTLTQVFANATGIPISTGISGLGTGIATALAVNTGSAGAPVLFNGALGTPTSGTVTNLTGTASININGTVGATTANTGAFTTLSASGTVTLSSSTAEVIKSNNTGLTIINGGSASTGTAGSQVVVVGVSHATIPGQLLLDYGTGGSIKMRDNGGVTKAEVSSTGLAVTGALSATRGSAGVVATLLSGNAAQSPFISFGRASEDLRLQIAAATNDLFTGTVAGDFAINSNASIWLGTAGTGRVKISSTGLAVTGALSSTTASTLCSTSGTLTVGSNTATGGGIIVNTLGTTGNMPYINFKSAGTQCGIIGLTGALLGTAATDLCIFAETGKTINLWPNGGTTGVIINTSGNVGIGTTSPSTRLHVNGDSTFNQGSGYVFSITGGSLSGSQQFRHWVSGTSYYIFNDSNQGVYLAYGGTSWTSNSDERAKDIIEPITDAADKVSSLRAVIGKYKTDSEGTRRSFLIAQDVQAVLPEAVDSSNPENLGVQYTEVIPLLVASIKELIQRVAALESN